ncbi:glycosyltransferase [Rhodococcus hoagii]|nr:glycosyltransferase [Prescottella equi]
MSGIIAHEWIENTGGAEKVVEAFSELSPNSPLLCLWDDAPGRFHESRVVESVIAKTPLRRNKVLALPVMPWVWRRWPKTQGDWVLISSHLFAHHLRITGNEEIDRFVYVHTPARYIWEPDLDERGKSAAARTVAPLLRLLDRQRAQEGGTYAANSRFVAERIARCWEIDAQTIYPPVDVAAIQSVADWRDELSDEDSARLSGLPDSFILGASRLVSYKKLDVVIQAGQITDTPVVIAGEGPDLPRLKAIADAARVPVHFMERTSTALLYALYQQCLVYVFAGVEDFGIMPVEAMAAGAPVVGNRVGGVAETVLDGFSGALCDPSDGRDLHAALTRAASCDPEISRLQARKFDVIRFKEEIVEWIGNDRISGHAEKARKV